MLYQLSYLASGETSEYIAELFRGANCAWYTARPTSSRAPAIDKATRPRLLIVDDSPVALAILAAVFKGEHYGVDTASDGLDGFDKARRTAPDLVITDGLMPGADGFELVRLMKADPATRSIPVLMLTSADLQDAEYQNRQPPPDAFIAKSMDMTPLLNRVREMLADPPKPA
jgi:CheY-like chemotaxis protein